MYHYSFVRALDSVEFAGLPRIEGTRSPCQWEGERNGDERVAGLGLVRIGSASRVKSVLVIN